jgi:hypothetical protein
VLHHDKVPAHTALSIQEFLAKKNIAVLPHPPYSNTTKTNDISKAKKSPKNIDSL